MLSKTEAIDALSRISVLVAAAMELGRSGVEGELHSGLLEVIESTARQACDKESHDEA